MTLSNGSQACAVALKSNKSKAMGNHYARHVTREDNVIRVLERAKKTGSHEREQNRIV